MFSTTDGMPQNGKVQLGVLEQRAIGQSIEPERTHTTHCARLGTVETRHTLTDLAFAPRK